MAGILNTIFVICLVIAILFFAISILLFFLFDIRTIFSIRTGRAAARTVKEMEQINANTGRLRVNKNTAALGKDKKDKKKPGVPVVQPPAPQPQQEQPQPQYPEYQQTEQLTNDETAMLTASETAVLTTDETALLSQQDYPAQPAPQSFDGETSVLNAAAFDSGSTTGDLGFAEDAPDVYFDVVKKIIVRDTDEIIR